MVARTTGSAGRMRLRALPDRNWHRRFAWLHPGLSVAGHRDGMMLTPPSVAPTEPLHGSTVEEASNRR